MAEKFTIDPQIAPFYEVTFILCALVCCEHCKREIEYASEHARYTDENYYDAAVAMHATGWVVEPETLVAVCPVCVAASTNGSRITRR